MIHSVQIHLWAAIPIVFPILLLRSAGVLGGAKFTMTNSCSEPIWPVVLDNATQQIQQYEVLAGSSVAFQRPNGWGGRVWAKTGCVFNDSGAASCSTGDTAAVTLSEFSLSSTSFPDFYDVSLVDGYNLAVVVKPTGGSGSGSRCEPAGCAADLNRICPAELRTQGGAACRSPCSAFGTAEYCCTGGARKQCGPDTNIVSTKEPGDDHRGRELVSYDTNVEVEDSRKEEGRVGRSARRVRPPKRYEDFVPHH